MFSKEMLPGIADIASSKILVIDDSNLNVKIITNFLKSSGYQDILTASNGKQGLEMAEIYKPDLIIIDLIMPIMDGISTIKTLRSQEELKMTPIIVQTGISDPEQQLSAWKAGANDIVSKPINFIELLTRIQNLLKQNFFIKSLDAYKKVMLEDLKQASELQLSLIPSSTKKQFLSKNCGINIESIFYPSRFLSGDLWGIVGFETPYKIGVWLCDFAGKGVRAALQTFKLHTLISNKNISEFRDHPDEFTKYLNQQLCAEKQSQLFATFLYGIIDYQNKVFSYASAGSTSPIIYNSQKEFVLCESDGIPLGIHKKSTYEIRKLSIESDSKILFYSDVMIEDKSLGENNFSEENFEKILKNQDLIKFFSERYKGKNLSDDLTLVQISKL
jgi:sigma-B regulation protein RsbU (phosphoserine phosphatase)